MKLLHYVETENFKQLDNGQRIELDHPSILIGPNNCGKTTVLEAIAFWYRVIRFWHENKAIWSSKTRMEIPIQPPRADTRFYAKHFWHNGTVSKDDQDVPIVITLGINHDNKIVPVTLHFYYEKQNRISSELDSNTREKPEILNTAVSLNVALLHPISRLDTAENVLTGDDINELIIKGRAGQTLRNLCFHAHNTEPDIWEEIVDRMKHCFAIKLHSPVKNSQWIELTYEQNGSALPLDISFAGRGLQQILLALLCLYSYNRSVLLIDEPDAHLEILRQRQIYTLLRSVATETKSQVVMTTHSEILVDEGFRRGTLRFLLNGKIQKLPSQKSVFYEQRIAAALKYFGTQQYFQARQYGHVLYLEGSTDWDILTEFAKRLRHPVTRYLLNAEININYISGNLSKPDIESRLKRIDGVYGITPKEHFESLKKLVPGIRGLVILDGDGKNQKDIKGSLPIVFWKRYEIENYFITRELLIKSISHYDRKHTLSDDFKNQVPEILDKLIQERIFEGKLSDFDTWRDAPPNVQRLIWETKTTHHKLSAFAKDFYKRLADATEKPILYGKSQFYQLIELVEPEFIPKEVTKKLDRLQKLLENSDPQK